MRIIFSIILATVIAGASVEKSDQLVTSLDISNEVTETPKGLWPFLGAGAGLAAHDVNGHQDGVPGQLKLLGSYYLTETPWVAEAGLGFQNYRFTSAGRSRDETWSGLLELSGRYRFANRWQAGPQIFMAIGNGEDFKSSNSNLTSYIGAQALREWNGEKNIYRLGGRMLADISIPERTALVGLIEFHMSLGGHKQTASAQPVEKPVVFLPSGEPNKIILPPVNFDTGMVSPYDKVSDRVREFAEVLAKNSHLFGSITISGHADYRGPDSVNHVLSFSRAQNIRRVLSQAGLNDSKIKVVGFGEHKPLRNGRTTIDLMRNRRVEIQFHDVTDQEAMDKILRIVQ